MAFTHLNCRYELSFASPIMCNLIQECVGVPRIYYCKGKETWWPNSWCAGLWVERSGFETGLDHCVVFLSKKPYSHIASLHPGVEMGTSELSGKPDNMPKGNFAMDWHPIKERVVIMPVVFILKKPG